MKKISTIIIVLIILIGGLILFFPKSADHQVENNLDFNNVNVVIRDMTNIPIEYYSGNSRFSHGECEQDGDCFEDGCNLEMCTSDKNMLTTCEIGGDFPDKNIYACGCIKDTCGWYSK